MTTARHRTAPPTDPARAIQRVSATVARTLHRWVTDPQFLPYFITTVVCGGYFVFLHWMFEGQR